MTILTDDAESALYTAQTQALLTYLMAAITTLAFSQMPAVAVTDLYEWNNPFNLTTRAGDRAFEDISNPLDTIWDGMVQTFPSFSSILTRRANNGGWDRVTPHGILKVNVKNFLEDSQSITKAEVVTALIARTDPRAIQNCKALFKCLESSIPPSVKSTIFDQPKNKPTGNDGVEFCCKLAKFTNFASTQLSILSQNKLLVFDPSVYNFNVSLIKTKLQALFVLIRTRNLTISEFDKLQHAIKIYEQIKQPSKWKTWVETRQQNIDNGLINN